MNLTGRHRRRAPGTGRSSQPKLRSRPAQVAILFLSALALAASAVGSVPGTEAPSASAEAPAYSDELSPEQFLVLREAFGLVTRVGAQLWDGWASIPLTVLVVDEEYEFLVNAPQTWIPSGEFVRTEQQFLGNPVYRRPRTLPPALRAAFPIEGLPAAIVGAWRAREESPNEWALTLVHEWFHVMQMNRDEAGKVRGLALGQAIYPSLQLDYPFAYGDKDIGHAVHLLGQALYDFWTRSRTLPRAVQRTFLAETSYAALQNLRTIVTLKYGEEAYSYFRYQTWKEGVARYSQVQVSLMAADMENRGRFRPIPGFGTLQGNMSYARVWEEIIRTNYWMIRASTTTGAGDPTSFYGIGHGLAELLDSIHPTWKERYFEPDVWLDDLITEVMDPEASNER